MPKGKIKELLFDINSSELVELDENGNPIENPEEQIQNEIEDKKEINDQLEETGSFEIDEKEILVDTKEVAKSKKNQQPISKESQESIAQGKEKLEAFASKSAKTADKALKNAKVGMSKGAEKTGNLLKNVQEGSKPFFEKAGQNIKKGSTSLGASVSKSFNNAKESIKKGGIKEFAKNNKITLVVALLVVMIGGGIYAYRYQSLPNLSETHTQNAGNKDYSTYNADVHPMQILSTTRENMVDFKGEPADKGDGKTPETKYVIYSMGWFGKNRKTVMNYDNSNHFTKIKLEIGNESAQSIYDKLLLELGTPLDDQNPTVKGGYAIWIKDAVRYKMLHRGSYSTIEMSIASYDNSAGLQVGKYPIVIQSISHIDLNGDSKLDEKILLLGNKANSVTTNFDKLYLLVWDGKKTYLKEMDEEFDGGSFPQIDFMDTDGDKKEEIVVISDNNFVKNYHAFKYTETSVDKIYSGYEAPKKSNE